MISTIEALFQGLQSITFFPEVHTTIDVLYYAAQLCLVYFVFHAVRILFILLINKGLAMRSTAFISDTESDDKILILGDSTAVGTGARNPSETIGGLLARDFPDAQIINEGINGSSLLSLATQLERVSDQSFNLIIISSGGNDTWQPYPISYLRKSLALTLNKAKEVSNGRVIFLINNNVGLGPFPFPIRSLLKRRAKKVMEMIEKTAYIQRVPTIELFVEERNNPFLSRPEELLAADGIHPSSEGYAVWYKRMWRIMVAEGYRFKM